MKKVRKSLAVSALLIFILTAALPVFAAENEMPAWYPEDPSAWQWTAADPDAPRVIDEADVLSPDEERTVSEAVRAAAEATGTDIVIFTDTSSHGMDIMDYADDFFDYGGYGKGAEHDGFCLCLIVSGRDREGWCSTKGSPDRFYTQDAAEALDDALYGYLSQGRYCEGIVDWSKNITNLMTKGHPFTPAWWPDAGKPSGPADPNAPRVTDDTGTISSEKLEKLAAKAKAISEKYGVDVAVHFSDAYPGLAPEDISDTFYNLNGYGGEEDNGILLTVFPNGDPAVMTVGAPLMKRLNSRNFSRLLKGANMLFDNGPGSANRWLKYLDRTLKTGHTPKTPVVWALASAFCAVIALVVSGVNGKKAVESMKTVVTAFTAGDHLINDTLSVRKVGDDLFLRSEKNRSYSPPVSSGGGRSGSHSSSYSGGHTSHSGSTHSGSGRRF